MRSGRSDSASEPMELEHTNTQQSREGHGASISVSDSLKVIGLDGRNLLQNAMQVHAEKLER